MEWQHKKISGEKLRCLHASLSSAAKFTSFLETIFLVDTLVLEIKRMSRPRWCSYVCILECLTSLLNFLVQSVWQKKQTEASAIGQPIWVIINDEFKHSAFKIIQRLSSFSLL